jgi:hypothetical protein
MKWKNYNDMSFLFPIFPFTENELQKNILTVSPVNVTLNSLCDFWRSLSTQPLVYEP